MAKKKPKAMDYYPLEDMSGFISKYGYGEGGDYQSFIDTYRSKKYESYDKELDKKRLTQLMENAPLYNPDEEGRFSRALKAGAGAFTEASEKYAEHTGFIWDEMSRIDEKYANQINPYGEKVRSNISSYYEAAKKGDLLGAIKSGLGLYKNTVLGLGKSALTEAEKAKDIGVMATTGLASGTMSALSAPYGAVMSAALVGTGLGDNATVQAGLSKIDAGTKWLGRNATDLYELGQGAELSEESRSPLEYGLGEGAAEVATFGLLKGAGNILSNVKMPKINKVENVEELIGEIEKAQSKKLVDMGARATLSDELRKLDTDINLGKATQENIDATLDRFNLDDGGFFSRKLEELNDVASTKKKTTTEVFMRDLKTSGTKLVASVINDLDVIPVKERVTKFKEVADKYKIPETLVESIYNNKEVSTANTFKEVYENRFNIDTFDNQFNSQRIAELEAAGMVKKSDIEGGYQFLLTKKGETALKEVAPEIALEFKDNGIIVDSKIYDYTVGDSKRKADILVEELKGDTLTSKLASLYKTRISGKSSRSTDNQIINNLNEIDNKFNLGIRDIIEDIYIPGTRTIDSRKLEGVVNIINQFRKENYLSNFKGKLEGDNFIKLSTAAKLVVSAANKAKKITLKEYGLLKGKLDREFQSQIDGLKLKLSKTSDLNKAEKLAAKAKLRATEAIYESRMIELESKAGNLAKVKQMFKDGIKNSVRGKIYRDIFDKAINKDFYRASGFDEASTPKQLETAIGKINKDLAKAYAASLVERIRDELSVDKVGISSSDAKKSKYTAGDRIELLEASKLFNSLYKNQLSISSLEGFLGKVLIRKKEASLAAIEDKRNKQLNTARDIDIIREQGINNLEGRGDLTPPLSFYEKAKKNLSSWNNLLRMESFQVEKIAGGVDKLFYNVFHIEPRKGYTKFEKQLDVNLYPLVDVIFNKFKGEELNNFTYFISSFRRRATEEGYKFLGMERALADPENPIYKKRETKSTIVELPADAPLHLREYWDKKIPIINKDGKFTGETIDYRDTKHAEILEKYNNSDYSKVSTLVFNAWKIAGDKVAKIAEEYDGTPMSRDEFYSPSMIKGGYEAIESINVGDYIGEFEKSNLVKGFLEEAAVTPKKGTIYENDIIKILNKSLRQQYLYTEMTPSLSRIKGVLYGKRFKYKDLTAEEIDSLSKKNNFQYSNISTGEPLVPKKGPDGSLQIKDGKILFEDGLVDIDDVAIGHVGGIYNSLSASTKKWVKEKVRTIAKGGNHPESEIEYAVNKVATTASGLPITANIGTVLKQTLTLGDLMANTSVREALEGIKHTFADSDTLKALYKVEAIKQRVGPDVNIADLMADDRSTASKILAKYTQYGTFPMRWVDKHIYATVFNTYYRKYMTDNGLLDRDGTIKKFNNKDALAYAETNANQLSGTTNPLEVPAVIRNNYTKVFFGLFGTMLARVQKITDTTTKRMNDGDYVAATTGAALFLATNLTEIVMSYGIAKAYYTLGLSNYDIEEELVDKLVSFESLYRITLGQTFVGSRVESLVGFDKGVAGINPTLTLGDNILSEGTDISKAIIGAIKGEDTEIARELFDFLAVPGGGFKQAVTLVENSLLGRE